MLDNPKMYAAKCKINYTEKRCKPIFWEINSSRKSWNDSIHANSFQPSRLFKPNNAHIFPPMRQLLPAWWDGNFRQPMPISLLDIRGGGSLIKKDKDLLHEAEKTYKVGREGGTRKWLFGSPHSAEGSSCIRQSQGGIDIIDAEKTLHLKVFLPFPTSHFEW